MDHKQTSSKHLQKRKMLQFVSTSRDMPQKRDAKVRNEDFLEIYGDYIDIKAQVQASRCS